MNIKLRPIIKWTGGKYDEFALFADHIPAFSRYIEPFFGGGGVFFALQPQVHSLINDKSSDLINFYHQIGGETFKTDLLNYADAWDELTELHEKLWINCKTAFIGFVKEKITFEAFSERLIKYFPKHLDNAKLLKMVDFIVDQSLFEKMILASLADKAKRIKRIRKVEERNFSLAELETHFETGIKGGTYLFFRKLLNLQQKQKLTLTPSKAAANWYFIREFCYGAMFRFNAKGDFNIPYGGIAYNRKNFRKKVAKIFNAPITDLFGRTTITNLDFEAFFQQIELKKTDFIFVDPPYDSEFSEYDQSEFGRDDQERLASNLIKMEAKWMMVIKETTFIRELYSHPNVKIITFNKRYAYNVRGRNNRDVTHLIITNY